MSRIVVIADAGQRQKSSHADDGSAEVSAPSGQQPAAGAQGARTQGDPAFELPPLINYKLPTKYWRFPAPSRVCFWRNIELTPIKTNQDIPVPEIFSTAEFPRSQDLLADTGLLVISWDSANGDSFYRSDETLNYLKTQGQIRISKLLSMGGTILMEGQTSTSRLVQDPYDAVFGEGELAVHTGWADIRSLAGPEAYPVDHGWWRWKARHPLLARIGERVTYKPNGRFAEDFEIYENVHPDFKPTIIADRPNANGDRNVRFTPGVGRDEYIWYGWFTSWGRDWIPLLGSKPKTIDAPVLLAKVVDNGLLLASTMWMSASQITIASRIAELTIDEELRGVVREYHRARLKLRNAVDRSLAVVGIISTAAAIGILAAAWDYALVHDSHAGAIALSVVGLGALSLTFSASSRYSFVRSRPYGVHWYQQLFKRRKL
jgi:hypothetical protein